MSWKSLDLDLHGLSHEEARTALVKKIESLWGRDIELKIITGHSHRMTSIVFEVLKEYKLQYWSPSVLIAAGNGHVKTNIQ